MNVDQCKKFMEAVEAAGIKTYQFDTDLGTHLYHDTVNAVAIPNHDLECVVAFRANQFNGSHGVYRKNIQCVMSDYGDIHECRTAGTFNEVMKFAEIMGVTLSEEDSKILLSIENNNNDIKPITGNYVDKFNYLTQKQYEALSDEEKAKYDSEKAAFEEAKQKYIGKNMAACITL